MALDPLAAIRRFESGGRNVNTGITPAQNYGRSSSASGYYQMIDPTWRTAAAKAGIDTQQYPRAIDAPYDVQTRAAAALYQSEGFRPWTGIDPKTGKPYNPTLAAYVQQQGGPGAFSHDAIDYGNGTTNEVSSTGATPGGAYGDRALSGIPGVDDAGNPYSRSDSGLRAPIGDQQPDLGYTGIDPNSGFTSGLSKPNPYPFPYDAPSSGNPAIGGIGNPSFGFDQGIGADRGNIALDPLYPYNDSFATETSDVVPGFSSTLGGAVGSAVSGAITGGSSNFWPGLFKGAADFLTRAGLLLLGLVLIAVAAWAMSKNDGGRALHIPRILPR